MSCKMAEVHTAWEQVLLEQKKLLSKLQLTGEAVSLNDKIVCSKGALALDEIYLERIGGCEKGDSGWFIGSTNEDDEVEEYEAYWVHQLLEIRPAIMKVLSLPSGYLVVFNKDELIAVLDENDEEKNI